VIAEDLAVQSPEHSLALRRRLDDGGDELRFLSYVSRTPGVGEREEVENSLEAMAPCRRLDVLRDDRRQLDRHPAISGSAKRIEEGRRELRGLCHTVLLTNEGEAGGSRLLDEPIPATAGGTVAHGDGKPVLL